MSSTPAACAAAKPVDARFSRRLRRLRLGKSLLLLAMAAIGLILILQALAQSEAVSRTAAMQMETEHLRSNLLGAGRVAQAAMLQGQSAVQAVATLRSQALRQLEALRGRVVAGAESPRELDELVEVVHKRFDLLLDQLLGAPGALEPAAVDPQTRERLAAAQRIEALLNDFQATQERRRPGREQEIANLTRAGGGLLIALALLTLALQALTARAVANEVRRSSRAESGARDAATLLEKSNAELERRVGERTQALIERNDSMSRMHERLSAVSREMLRVVEAERRALARELHDDLGQQMAALKINLQLMRRYPLDRLDRIDDSVLVVDRCIARLRERVMSLRPPMLDELGLAEALRSHAQRQALRSGLSIQFDLATDFDALDDDWTSAVYRIAQEALHNVESHAAARHVWLSLRAEGDDAVLRIRDDGGGMRGSGGDESTGMGLLTMRERTELTHGVFSLISNGHGGVEVICRWALQEVLSRCGAARSAAV